MPILRIIKGPVSRAMYDAVTAGIHLDTRHPLGLIMHGASEVDGEMQVAQVWESEEYLRRFDDSLERAIKATGAPAATEDTIFELHHLVTP
jgi:hypothetical protein